MHLNSFSALNWDNNKRDEEGGREKDEMRMRSGSICGCECFSSVACLPQDSSIGSSSRRRKQSSGRLQVTVSSRTQTKSNSSFTGRQRNKTLAATSCVAEMSSSSEHSPADLMATDRSHPIESTSRGQSMVSGASRRRMMMLMLAVAFITLPTVSGQSNTETTSQPKVAASSSLNSSTENNSQDSASATTTNGPLIITTESMVTSDPSDAISFQPTQAPDSTPDNSTINKLKPVNFTLVDEIFDAVLSDVEVVKRWKFMDSQIQDGMKAILKMLFPQIVSISQDAKVSGDCSGGILKWILSLRNLRSWAIKMLDATGKPTAGIFEGSLTMFGNYRQCLSIRAPDEDEIEITDQFEEYFRGQFCVIHLKPWMPVKQPFYHLNSSIPSLLRKNYKYYEKTFYDELAEIAIAFNFIDIRMDLCVPSTCSVADIQRVAELLSRKLEMRAKVMRCDISPRADHSILNQIDRSTYLWLAVPLTLLAITLLASLLSLVLRLIGERPRAGANQAAANFAGPATTGSGHSIRSLLKCLSIGGALSDRLASPQGSAPADGSEYHEGHYTADHNSSASGGQVSEPQVSLLSVQRKPLPLYGLRNIFIFWFLIVQMTVELKYQYLRESLILRNMIISYWPFQIIVNSVLLFDSLILITAFTFSFTWLESTLKDLIGYVIDKYIRLILSIVTLIAITIVTPLISIESPVWRNFVEEQANVCKSTGYLDLFFLQNFISYDKICLPHTWLFCVELQLIILSIPLVLLLKNQFQSTEDSIIIGSDRRSTDQDEECSGTNHETVCLIRLVSYRLLKSKAGLLSSALVAVGMFVNFFTVYTNQLPPSWFYTFPDVDQKNYYFGQYLTKTWTHLSVFVIGLIGGHVCRSTIQLRNVKLLKSHQSPPRSGHKQQQRPSNNDSRSQQEQPSPAPSSSTSKSSQLNSSSQSHGSTSTIMAMERGVDESGIYQDSSSGRGSGSMRQVASFSLQLAALVCMAAIIFSTFEWSTKEGPSPLIAALYDAFSRSIWSLALVGLMIQLCLPGERSNKHSFMAQLFGHPICTLMGRLSFLAYLLSPYVHTIILAVEEQSLFPSLFLIFHVIVGNIVITYSLAFILAIVIEQPLRRLISRFVLGKRLRKQKINISTYYANSTLSVSNLSPGSIQPISVPLKPEN